MYCLDLLQNQHCHYGGVNIAAVDAPGGVQYMWSLPGRLGT